MIVKEFYKTREDGVILDRTYSDKGMMIERDGVRYSEAVDPRECNRTYIETDEPIEVTDETETIDPIDSDREYTETENKLPEEEELEEIKEN